jgi:hypothetical protein
MLAALALVAARSALAAAILSAPPEATAPSAGPAPTRTPAVRSPGNADWAPTLAEARVRAARHSKLVFVEFEQKGCGNCHRMDTLLYPAFDFEALLIGMVPVKLDLDSPDGQATALRYGITEAPSVLVVNSDGRLVFLMQGFLDAPDFYSHIRKDLDSYRAFARKVDRQDVGTLPGAEALQSGRDLYQRRDSAAALPRFARVANAPDSTAAERDSALELEAAALLDVGRAADSEKAIDKLIATTKDADMRERGELFRAQLPLSEGKKDEALRRFQAFRKAHPKSKYASEVDQLIQKLESAKTK